MRRILFLYLILTAFNCYSQDNIEIPNEIQKVFDYILEKDFPEVFNGEPYQIRPVAWQIIDIGNDGIIEVFLQTFPHYRQSPTITIYQIHENDSISRITEGLAPGHLIPLSAEDDYFDSHNTGTAIDMQLGSDDAGKMGKFAQSSLGFGMSTVLYKNFIHTDKRDGEPIYIDLRYLDDYPDESSCRNFQFSKPEAIISGKVKGQEFDFFIAKVEEEFFCYQIKGFIDNRFIDKEVMIIKIPNDFVEFVLENGIISYRTTKGKLKLLKI